MDVTPSGAAVTEARLHLVAALVDDAAFEMMHVQPLTERVQRMLSEPLGAAARRVDAVGAGAKTELPRFVADALAARSRAAGFAVDFALVDASSVCAGLPTDRPLTFGDLFRLAPYADSIVLRRFTPAQLRAFLLTTRCATIRRAGRSRRARNAASWSSAGKCAAGSKRLPKTTSRGAMNILFPVARDQKRGIHAPSPAGIWKLNLRGAPGRIWSPAAASCDSWRTAGSGSSG